jgi:hypothetical protein
VSAASAFRRGGVGVWKGVEALVGMVAGLRMC